MTSADRKRVEAAIVSAQLMRSAGLSHNVQGATELALRVSLGEVLEAPVARYVRSCLAAVVHRELGHVRKGRESARAFIEGDGAYWATRPIPEREEMAARQVRDEPKHVREAKAALRLRRVVARLRAPAGAVK